MAFALPESVRLPLPGPALRAEGAETVRFWLIDAEGKILTTLSGSGERREIRFGLPMLAGAIVRSGARFIVMAHTHPGHDPSPSDADIDATRRIWRLARTLGASVQDHIIEGDGGSWFSFRANGLL